MSQETPEINLGELIKTKIVSPLKSRISSLQEEDKTLKELLDKQIALVNEKFQKDCSKLRQENETLKSKINKLESQIACLSHTLENLEQTEKSDVNSLNNKLDKQSETASSIMNYGLTTRKRQQEMEDAIANISWSEEN